jgi:hypothetical protein
MMRVRAKEDSMRFVWTSFIRIGLYTSNCTFGLRNFLIFIFENKRVIKRNGNYLVIGVLVYIFKIMTRVRAKEAFYEVCLDKLYKEKSLHIKLHVWV